MQHKKHFQLPHNTIIDRSLREIIIREYLSDSTIAGDKWTQRAAHFIIQECYGYPHRYIVADTSNFMFDLMDFFSQNDTLATLKHIIAGKYLGEFMDDSFVSKRPIKKIIINFPYRCWIEHEKIGGYNYSDVTVLYEMNEQTIRPIEILDFKCSGSEELDMNPGCFCDMNRKQFKIYLHNKIILPQQDSITLYGSTTMHKYKRLFKPKLLNAH